MPNTFVALARSRIAIALFALLLMCGSGVALASCGTNAGLQGAIASIDSAGSSFMLTPRHAAGGPSSVTVTITPQTEFRGALRGFSDLTVGLQVSVQGSPKGGTSTLTATEIEDQREDAAGDKNGAEDGDQFKGTVESTDAAHASFGLKLADGAIKTVTTSSQTEFEGTLHRFADLTKGLRVSVKGALQADGSIAAASVEAENEDEDDQDNAEDVELTGTISSLAAAQASFVLKLADGTTRTVVTNAQTEFDGGFHGFADLKMGMSVEVRGTSQSDGSLLATRVHREDSGDGGHDGSGSGGSGGDDHGGSGGGGDDGSGHH